MKNIKLLLIGLVAVFALGSCSSSDDEPNPTPQTGDGTVVGQWHMVSWSTLTAADVYLSFTDAGSFELYQRLYTPAYVHLKGNFSYQNGTLSGNYSDNTAWGHSYSVSFNTDGTQMTLTSTASAGDVAVFVQSTIPDEITSGVLEASALSRSEELVRFL